MFSILTVSSFILLGLSSNNAFPTKDLVDSQDKEVRKVMADLRGYCMVNALLKDRSFTALMGKVEEFNNLLSNSTSRIDLNAKTKDNMTALHFASQSGRLDYVKTLIADANIEVNAKDVNGQTPLHYASKLGHSGVVKALLDHKNINFEAKDNDLKLAIDLARMKGSGLNEGEKEMASHQYDQVIILLKEKMLKRSQMKDICRAMEARDQAIVVKSFEGFSASDFHLSEGRYKIFKWNFIDYTNDLNFNRLHCYSYVGLTEQVESFLSKKESIDVNAKTKDNITALQFAVQYGHLEIVNILLEQKNIDLNTNDSKFGQPLYIASVRGNFKIVETLLKCDGIDINAKCHGETALHTVSHYEPFYYASNEDYLRVVVALLSQDQINVNAKDKKGRTPLHFASYNSHLEVVKVLLAHQQIDVNSKDVNGQTPLHYASYKSLLEVVKVLLAHQQIDVNSKDVNGQTPLHFASYNPNLEVVKVLLAHQQIDVNAKDENGQTPLHFASKFGHFELVKVLLDQKNIKNNANDKDGASALELAMLRGSRLSDKEKEYVGNQYDQVIDALLKAKLKVSLKKEICEAMMNNEDANAAALFTKLNASDFHVSEDQYKGLQEAFLASVGQNFALLHCYSFMGFTDKVKNLLTVKGADVNVENDAGYTALHWASQMGHFEIVESLVKVEGINVNAKRISGKTPLHAASQYGQLDIVKALLAVKGIDVNIKDNNGETALDLAEKNPDDQPQYEEIIKALKEKMALSSSQGWSFRIF